MSAQKDLMPVIFIGHGSPENALDDNEFTQAWRKLAKSIPRPKVILCVSAHWLTEGTAVTAMRNPRTIHDFYGFPDKLYRVTYDTPGSPDLAFRIKYLVGAQLDHEWGLDHGTWSVLMQMYPEADIPVVQLSLDYQMPLKIQMEAGIKLRVLRESGVLIVGSGNIVHNLMMINFAGKPFDWAVEFDKFVRINLEQSDFEALIDYSSQETASLAQPTNDHYLPLMFVIGASDGESPQFFNDKIFAGSLSMRCVAYSKNKLV
jgi:4,5-DOPA dioxygenase extradiol